MTVGLVVGAIFLALASDVVVRVTIGILLLVVVAITLWRRRTARAAGGEPSRVSVALYGGAGGFTTMVANAAGPVMSMYFLAARFPVQAFLGTSARFFAIVNIAKLPFSVGLGLLTPQGLLVDLVLAPVVIGAAFIGRAIAQRIDQRLFERLVIALTIVGSLYLLLPR